MKFKKRDKPIAIFMTTLIVIVAVAIIIGVVLFGFIGILKVGSYFNLLHVDLAPSRFSNILYFGWLLIFVYMILVLAEGIIRFLMRNIKISLMKVAISDMLQVALGTVLIKLLIDKFFERIEVSYLSVGIFVFIFYVYFFLSGIERNENDDNEESLK